MRACHMTMNVLDDSDLALGNQLPSVDGQIRVVPTVRDEEMQLAGLRLGGQVTSLRRMQHHRLLAENMKASIKSRAGVFIVLIVRGGHNHRVQILVKDLTV